MRGDFRDCPIHNGFADIELVLHFTNPSLLERNNQELERSFRIGTSYGGNIEKPFRGSAVRRQPFNLRRG